MKELYARLYSHLVCGHYPPIVGDEWIDLCWRAIQCVGNNEPDRFVELPNAVRWNQCDADLVTAVPASWVVEKFHLESFVSKEDM